MVWREAFILVATTTMVLQQKNRARCCRASKPGKVGLDYWDYGQRDISEEYTPHLTARHATPRNEEIYSWQKLSVGIM